MSNTNSSPNKYVVINRHLAYYRNAIVANPFEATKAYLIAHAEGKLSKYLPHSVSVLLWPDDDSDGHPDAFNLYRWYMGLSGHSREAIEPLDLSKPYDADLIARLDAQKKKPQQKTIEVDAVAIVEAEND